IYIDDANLAPACGFGSKQQKYMLVYLTVADLPFQHRVHMEDIEMLLCVNREKLMAGYESSEEVFINLFAHLKTELDELMQHSIKVRIGDRIETIHVAVSSICGDNLGKFATSLPHLLIRQVIRYIRIIGF